MNTEPKLDGRSPDEVKLTARILLATALVLLLATVAVRWILREYDGGLANVLTLIMGFTTWLLAVLGLILSPWSRSYWQSLAAMPFVLVAVVLSVYRVTRLDGELVPQLEPRWQSKAELPIVQSPGQSAIRKKREL